MSKSKILATILVVILLGTTMYGVKHIDNLNDGIKIKQIEIKDNSLKLELLDKRYNELQDKLKQKHADTEEIQKQFNELQNERNELEKQLQAKKEQKERDLAVRAQRAVTGTQVASAATSVSGSCTDWMQQAGISHPDAMWLIGKESSCRSNAINPSSYACGIAQELLENSQRAQQIASVNAGVCPKSGCSMSDPVCQMRWMSGYVSQRYGSWSAARAFHLANNWY